MSDVRSTTRLWCSCGREDADEPEYVIIKQDWHGEHIVMKCPQCGHTIKVDRSLVSPMTNYSGV
jgi:hypothetical protein